MIQERISACDASIALMGDKHAQAAINNTKRHQSSADLQRHQPILSDNLHEKDNNSVKERPVHVMPLHDSKRSFAINSAVGRLRDILGLYSSGFKKTYNREARGDEGVKDLLQLFGSKELGALFHHRSSSGEFRRRIRSERVRTCHEELMPTLLRGVDLKTLAIGFWDNRKDRQVYYDYGYIQQTTNLSKSQIYRSIALYKKLGLIRTERIVERNEVTGKYKHKETRLFLTEKIFNVLGLRKEFLQDRHYALGKHKEMLERKKLRMKYLEDQNTALNTLMQGKMVNRPQKPKPTSPAKSLVDKMCVKKPIYNPSSDKQVITMAYRFIKENLCASMREAITMACANLSKPPPS